METIVYHFIKGKVRVCRDQRVVRIAAVKFKSTNIRMGLLESWCFEG